MSTEWEYYYHSGHAFGYRVYGETCELWCGHDGWVPSATSADEIRRDCRRVPTEYEAIHDEPEPEPEPEQEWEYYHHGYPLGYRVCGEQCELWGGDDDGWAPSASSADIIRRDCRRVPTEYEAINGVPEPPTDIECEKAITGREWAITWAVSNGLLVHKNATGGQFFYSRVDKNWHPITDFGRASTYKRISETEAIGFMEKQQIPWPDGMGPKCKPEPEPAWEYYHGHAFGYRVYGETCELWWYKTTRWVPSASSADEIRRLFRRVPTEYEAINGVPEPAEPEPEGPLFYARRTEGRLGNEGGGLGSDRVLVYKIDGDQLFYSYGPSWIPLEDNIPARIAYFREHYTPCTKQEAMASIGVFAELPTGPTNADIEGVLEKVDEASERMAEKELLAGHEPTIERTTTMRTIKFDKHHACPYCGMERGYHTYEPTGAAIIITCGQCGAKFLMLARGVKLPKPPRGERGPKGERGLLAKATIGALKYGVGKPIKYLVLDTLHDAKQGASRTVGSAAGIAGLFALVCWLVPYVWDWFLSVLPW